MSEVNWTQVRRAAEEARIETSCMHGTSCHDVLCVERQARGECLATAAEAVADLGPLLDKLQRMHPFHAVCGCAPCQLWAAWTTARAKLVTT